MIEFITRNDVLADSDRDIFNEILPDIMEYFVVDDEGKPIITNGVEEKASFKEVVHDSMVQMYGDRCVNEELEYWVQKNKAWFNPLLVSELGKKYSIWMQNREFELDYVNIQEKTVNTRIEPVRNASSSSETPSTKDILERSYKQPVGAMGTAIKVRDSMNAIKNPLAVELYFMEKMFIAECIIERMMKCQMLY